MRSRSEDKKALTSLRVFRKYITKQELPNGEYELDASNVVSRECFELWLKTRKTPPPCPEKAFQRALSAHIGGVDGRSPFTVEEEKAVLITLRRKIKWPCFAGSTTRFGLMGFRAKGYHERAALGLIRQSPRKTARGVGYEEEEDEDDNDDDDKEVEELQNIEKDDEEEEDDEAHSEPETSMRRQDIRTLSRKRAANHSPLTVSKKGREGLEAIVWDQREPTPPDGSNSTPFGDPFLRWLYQKAVAILLSFQQSGTQAWERILELIRFVLMSRGIIQQGSEEEIDRIFHETCEEYPGDLVIFVNALAKNPSERVVRVNEKARALLGPISRDEEGLTRRLFPAEYQWVVLKCIVWAWSRPRNFVPMTIPVVDANGQTHTMDLTIRTAPEVMCVIVRARQPH